MASILLLTILLFVFGILGLAVTVYMRYMYHKRILAKAKHDRPSLSEGPDVIVIGSGTVGTALATLLARDGRKVTLIDKSRKPQETIAGQGWLPSGVIDLNENGLELEPQAVEATVWTENQVHTPQKVLEMIQKHPGLLGDNPKYVQALRKYANAEKNCTFIEGSVRSLVKENEAVVGVQYHLKGEAEIKTLHAPLTVVADGRHSKFRSVNGPCKPVVSCYGLGINNPRPYTFDEKAVQFVPLSVGVCYMFTYDIPRITAFLLFVSKQPDKAFLRKLASEFPDKFRDLFLETVEINSIKIHRGYYLQPTGNFVPGVISLGDAYSMRDPCTACGMTIGLKDTLVWRKLIQQIPDLYNYDVMYAASNVFAVERKSYSFACDLFTLFFSTLALPTTDAEATLGQGYGAYVSEDNPKRMQSITDQFAMLERRPHVLFHHMTLITLKAMVLAVTSESWWTFPQGIYKAVAMLCMTASFVLPHLWSELRAMFIFQAKPYN